MHLATSASLLGLPNIIEGLADESNEYCRPPTARFSISDTIICTEECIDFTDMSIDSATSWLWRFDAANPSTSTEQHPQNICYPTPGTYTAMLIASNANGSDTLRKIVYVRESPPITVSPDATICGGGSARLSVAGAANLRYQWSPATGLSCTSCTDPIATPATTTTYSVTATTPDGCVTTRNVLVRVSPLPIASAGPDAEICWGDTVTLAASGGARYQWSPATGLSCTDCQTPIASPATTTRYSVLVTSAEGCQARDEVTVTVNTLPNVSAGRDTTICAGDAARLTASGAGTYQWVPSESLSCTDCRNPIASPTTTTVYRLIVTDPNGCRGTDSVRVTVIPSPVLQTDPSVMICKGDRATLRATGGVSYRWSPSTGLSCTDCASPVASPAVTTTYRVTARGAGGCETIDSVIVVVDQAPRTVRAHMDRSYGAYPGTTVTVPVYLDEPLDLANATDIEFILKYNPGITQIEQVILDGTLLEGWNETIILRALDVGQYRARYLAIPPRPVTGTGQLLLVRFLTYMGVGDSSELSFELRLNGRSCTQIITSPGLIRLDSICGLNFRLVESMSGKYALEGSTPNPFNPMTTIGFSLGLDGPTRIDVFNAAGERVARLIDEYMQPGRYSVTWDGSAYPSGVYHYRITSGEWTRTGRMLLVK